MLAKRAPVPKSLMTSGATMTMPMSWATLKVRLKSEFAEMSCSLGRSMGMAAASAGAKNWLMMEKTKVTT